MRILLDECVPVELARELSGHVADTVVSLGWRGVSNGQLLRRAAPDYDVFLTVDQRVAIDQAIPSDLAIITLRARSNSIGSLRPLVPAIFRALETIKPGETVRIGP